MFKLIGFYQHVLAVTFSSVHASAGEDRTRENAVGTTESQSAGGAAGTEAGSSRRRLHCCIRVTTVQVRKALWGVAMVMCMCSSWAGFTQLAKLTFKKFDAPFTLTWFATTWNCLFFPLYYIGHLCKNPERQSPRQRFRWGGRRPVTFIRHPGLDSKRAINADVREGGSGMLLRLPCVFFLLYCYLKKS